MKRAVCYVALFFGVVVLRAATGDVRQPLPLKRTITVMVAGEVAKPGRQVVRIDDPSVLHVIARAGDFTRRADRGAVEISRTNAEGREVKATIDFHPILRGEKRDDFVLVDGDTIFVPERSG